MNRPLLLREICRKTTGKKHFMQQLRLLESSCSFMYLFCEIWQTGLVVKGYFRLGSPSKDSLLYTANFVEIPSFNCA